MPETLGPIPLVLFRLPPRSVSTTLAGKAQPQLSQRRDGARVSGARLGYNQKGSCRCRPSFYTPFVSDSRFNR
jgi:hypothetical protein